jgi:capsid protein
MGIFNRNKIKTLETQIANQNQQLASLQNSLFTEQSILFDGEKTEGELGYPKEVIPDYYSAGERAWELQLTNDVAKLIMNKWCKWVIGKGLRFNAVPPKDKIQNFNRDNFIDNVEYRFRTYMQSKYSDYSEMEDLHIKANECFLNAKTRGDVLVVLRIEDKKLNVQLIDGANVVNPATNDTNNYILDGVEYNAKGKHVAYHVYTENCEYVRVPAIDEKTGLKKAFLVYGSKFRLNETRGLPMLIEDFEKLKNLERYVDATVKNAEVSSEAIFVNEHDASSTGEDIFKTGATQGLAAKQKLYDPLPDLPKAQCFQKNLSRMTGGAAINNTIGGKLKLLKPDAESAMPDFLMTNLKLVFGSTGMPFEVALSVYNSNYSASRAATKDWEHVLKVETEYFAKQFYQPIYEMWLYNEVLNRNVDAYQLVQAYAKKDYITAQGISKATWTGVSVPSIDPLKEINAIRRTLADETTPLTTYEKATEQASQLDYTEVQEQVRIEREKAVEPIVTETKEVETKEKEEEEDAD